MHNNETEELWQLYNEQGGAIAGMGANKPDIYGKGLLHGAAHVWIWRVVNGSAEILVQKRAGGKRTWPNKYDISAAGHIDLGENPLVAAVREIQEEVGIKVREDELKLIGVQRVRLVAPNKSIENEFQWLYLLKVDSNLSFTMQDTEVASLDWKTLDTFRVETLTNNAETYVPHGVTYFNTVISAVEESLAGS